MGLSKSCKIKLFQQTTGWSTDKMRANAKAIINIIGDSDESDGGEAKDAVLYIEQNLTEEQKAQARTNIGTISKEEAEALVANNAIVVASLPEPSAETMGKTYLLGPDQNDNYIRYITSFDGTTYSWVPYGSTEMNLTQYAKKDTNAIEDNLAKFDANGNPVDSGISKDDIALKNGSYDNMSVGTAKNLEGRSIVTDSFFQRTTGGDAEISNGTVQLVEVKGKSQVWNQLVNEIRDAQTFNMGDSLEFDENKQKFHLINTSPRSAATFYISDYFDLINGHKYFLDIYYEKVSGDAPYSNTTLFFLRQSNSTIVKQIGFTSNIYTADNNTSVRVGIPFSGGVSSEIYCRIAIHDLTLLGIDNLTTVEEVEAWLADNIGILPYYPYNAGQVINNNFQSIESIGQNLLDPATGKAIILGEYSDVYGNYYGITGTHGTITFTDNLGNSETITPDAEGKFELLVPGILTVATPGEDCSVFLWWDGTKTEYTPYEVNVGKLDVTHIYGKKNGAGEFVRVWPTGMPGINDIKDSLKVVNGQVVAERKIGEVDMGNIVWSRNSNYGIFQGSISNLKIIGDADYSARKNGLLSPKYIISAQSGISDAIGDMCMLRGSRQLVHFMNTAFNDATAFKTAMTGVPLYFEVETPEVYTDLVYQGSSLFTDGTPVTLPVNYKVDNWGIENILPKNTESQILTSKPIITCKYSVDVVELLNTHDDEINHLGEQIEKLDERKPEKVGDYPAMSVGSANTLAGKDTKVEDFVFKALDCADGIAKLNSARGKSLVWNQLVGNDYLNSLGRTANTDMTVSGHSALWTPNANQLCAVFLKEESGYNYIPITSGHKVLIARSVKTSMPCAAMIYTGTWNSKAYEADGQWHRYSDIFTINDVQGQGQRLVQTSQEETVSTIEIKDVLFIDLTLMFGAGNEPATVDEIEALFPLPYYDYNEGEIISNKTEEVKVVGFNQWDEETRDGYYNSTTGVFVPTSGYIANKNPIRIFPNTQYYINRSIGAAPVRNFWDADGNFIAESRAQDGNLIFTTPPNAHYFGFAVADTELVKCINLSDPAKNGTYEPYKTNTIELNLPTLTGKLNGEGDSVVVFPNGLKSAGSVYDEIVGNKAIKRIGVVDLGSLSYSKSTAGGDNYRFGAGVNGKKNSGAILCEKYAVVTATWGEGIVAGIMTSNISIYIFDPVYNAFNVAEFKAAMDGVLLYYELATPEEYILDTPLPNTFQAYKGGTIKQLPENNNEPTTAPCIITATFSIDAVGTLIGLPKNYVSKESLQAMLNAMQSAGIIASYTMTFNENTNKYDFTFTAPTNS